MTFAGVGMCSDGHDLHLILAQRGMPLRMERQAQQLTMSGSTGPGDRCVCSYQPPFAIRLHVLL